MAYIQINDDQLDEIIKEEMLTSIMYLMLTAVSYLLQDIEKIKQTNIGYVFSKDAKVDVLKITALIDAYRLVLEHYGVTVEQL